MLKKLQKSDCIFLIAILAALVLHLSGLLTPLPYNDEALYPTTPLRFINGDVMIRHEWHLTQFSSLFSYLPVLTWLEINGSTEGIVLFLRIVYLTVYILTAVGIYFLFRRYKLAAVAAAILFFTQTPYRMLTISYISTVTLFLLFFTMCLYGLEKKGTPLLYIIAGICFAACCVCNPLYCFVYAVYIIFCVVQHKKAGNENETYRKFFSAKSAGLFSAGIGIMAAVCLAYFFVAGGTFSILPDGIRNLFASTEYGSVAEKLLFTAEIHDEISLHCGLLIPMQAVLMFFDKNRTKNNHRVIYLIFSFVISIIYIIGMLRLFLTEEENGFALSLPFAVFSVTCYALTKNKNKALFCCMWCPGIAGALLQFFAANTVFTAIAPALAISNIAGVIFVHDLFAEMRESVKNENETENSGKRNKTMVFCSAVICMAFCAQLAFNSFSLCYDRIPDSEEYTKVNNGPLAHFYLDEVYYESYMHGLNDMDIIKSRSDEEEPVLIISRMGWLHLYIDRPFAAYVSCLMTLEEDLLCSYYEQNPEKIPKYIYVGYADSSYKPDRETAMEKAEKLEEMFDCTREELSMGILLTVNG